ncbi:MAG: hypothetical protein ACOCWA_07300, partial [Bacteroidota bacterium]
MPPHPDWKNTRLILPGISPPKWENRMTREIYKVADEFLINEVFSQDPFGLFKGVIPEPRRKAG